RFRVTRKDKIMRRCAGKQHLLAKKNTKRKKRLSKMEMFADLWAKGFSLLGFEAAIVCSLTVLTGGRRCELSLATAIIRNPWDPPLDDAGLLRALTVGKCIRAAGRAAAKQGWVVVSLPATPHASSKAMGVIVIKLSWLSASVNKWFLRLPDDFPADQSTKVGGIHHGGKKQIDKYPPALITNTR
ncbi:hypothetical protein ACJX0J_005328, partial [Zea mays]